MLPPSFSRERNTTALKLTFGVWALFFTPSFLEVCLSMGKIWRWFWFFSSILNVTLYPSGVLYSQHAVISRSNVQWCFCFVIGVTRARPTWKIPYSLLHVNGLWKSAQEVLSPKSCSTWYPGDDYERSVSSILLILAHPYWIVFELASCKAFTSFFQAKLDFIWTFVVIQS